MNTTIVLEPPCEFINANGRLHHHAKAKLTKAWREAAYVAATARTFDSAYITCAIRFPNNIRRDVGNYYPTAKAIVDGLVDAGMLPDDNDTHLVGPDMRRHIPNGTPLVTITITPLEDS
jgi:crossover junction endodeoxyribonuclease RusA